jgi:outer membrane receptor protein involved in Fe transport
LEHSLKGGVDYYQASLLRQDDPRNTKHSDVESIDWFVFANAHLPRNFLLSLGYRESRFESFYREDKIETQIIFPPFPPIFVDKLVRGDPEDNVWRNNAFDLGLTYSLNPDTTFFASYAKSFRVPNTDEIALSSPDLRPQNGEHFDLGTRYTFASMVELGATLFYMRIKDEIAYSIDPNTRLRVNRNYDQPTVRKGIELDVRFYPLDWLYLWGNYTYMDATFEETDTFVPLVPQNQAHIGLEWQVTDAFVLAAVANFAGSRFDGDDLNNNRFQKIPAYQTVDAKLTYDYRRLRIFGGVNNLFDELYSTVAFSANYYPMPTRSYYAGLEWTF